MSLARHPTHRQSMILLVEDDAQIAAMVAAYLRENDYAVEIEARGDRAVDRILRTRPDLVMLDLTLPGEDGLRICHRVRPQYLGPILMLTARGEDNDEVMGLERGADAYLTKPATPRVLLAHVRALLRRSKENALAPLSPQSLQVADLLIDRTSRTTIFCGAPLQLTSGQFDLLWLFAKHAGKELSRPFLFEQLHGSNWDDFDRSIDLRVCRLRQKLSDRCGEEVIKTIRSIGYLFTRTL